MGGQSMHQHICIAFIALQRRRRDQCGLALPLLLPHARPLHACAGPAMPNMCTTCNGVGTLCCTHCNGTGVNDKETHELMKVEGGDLIQRNGINDIRWLMMRGGPCWICKGRIDMGCSDW